MPIKVLVTGAGGGVGQSVIKSLKNTDYDVISYDSSPLAAGLYMTENSWVGVQAIHENYVENVLEAAATFDCKFIIPGHDVELTPLVRNLNRFSDEGITVIASDLELIDLADDKFNTAQFLSAHGFDSPLTWNFPDFEWNNSPVVLKPRHGGARSKGTYFASNISEFHNFSKLVDVNNTVVQEWCKGDEYTCGTLTFDGAFAGSISMKRELRGGDTYKAFAIKNDLIENTLRQLCTILQPIGPCNFQLKLDGTRVRIFEINARFSGTTYLRKLCGFDEVLFTLGVFSGRKLPSLDWNEKTILRFWSELIIENSELKR